jgi:hypothetical protein
MVIESGSALVGTLNDADVDAALAAGQTESRLLLAGLPAALRETIGQLRRTGELGFPRGSYFLSGSLTFWEFPSFGTGFSSPCSVVLLGSPSSAPPSFSQSSCCLSAWSAASDSRSSSSTPASATCQWASSDRS